MSRRPSSMVAESEAILLLRDYGIAYPQHGLARSAQEAVGIAEGLGYPVVLKIVSADVVHKSDVGAVVVGIDGAEGVSQAYESILESTREHLPDADVAGVLVFQQAPAGLELIVGAMQDAMFGPVLMFGLGGIFAEVLKDVSFRVIPIGRADAQEMVREIQGYPLLTGTRGQTGCDIDALVDLLLAVSQVMEEHPEIEELDLNPVRLYAQGLLALDARVMRSEA